MLKWVEGFELHAAATLPRKYAAVSGSPSNGAGGRLQGNYGNLGPGVSLTTPSFGLQNTWTVGFGFWTGAVDLGTSFVFYSGATEQLRLKLVVSGTGLAWELHRGASVLVGTATSHALSTWHYFELQVTIHPSAGAFEIRHNETLLTSATAQNTANSGVAGADVMSFGHCTSGTARWDDLYICDGTGSQNNTFLGDQVVTGHLPTSDGSKSQMTPSTGTNHAALVDDPAGSPNDADYVSSDAVGEIDLWHYPDDAFITGAIAGIQVSTTAAMAATGTRTIRSKFRAAGGTEADGPSHVIASAVPLDFAGIMELDPVTALPWVLADLNAGQFGVETVA